MTKRENEYRDPLTKQYAYMGNFERMCVCGHRLACHIAGGFECGTIPNDYPESKGCQCVKFSPLRLTKAQRAMLEKLAAVAREFVPNEYNFGNKTRVCERLVNMGMASHYPHGGFIITDYGRVALSESKGGES